MFFLAILLSLFCSQSLIGESLKEILQEKDSPQNILFFEDLLRDNENKIKYSFVSDYPYCTCIIEEVYESVEVPNDVTILVGEKYTTLICSQTDKPLFKLNKNRDSELTTLMIDIVINSPKQLAQYNDGTTYDFEVGMESALIQLINPRSYGFFIQERYKHQKNIQDQKAEARKAETRRSIQLAKDNNSVDIEEFLDSINKEHTVTHLSNGKVITISGDGVIVHPPKNTYLHADTPTLIILEPTEEHSTIIEVDGVLVLGPDIAFSYNSPISTVGILAMPQSLLIIENGKILNSKEEQQRWIEEHK